MKYALPLLLVCALFGAGCASSSPIQTPSTQSGTETQNTASGENVTTDAANTTYKNSTYAYQITYPTAVNGQPVKRASSQINSAYAVFKQTTALTLASGVTMTISVYGKNSPYFADTAGFDRVTVAGRPAFRKASANSANSWLIDTLIPGDQYDYSVQYSNSTSDGKNQALLDLQDSILASFRIGS